MRSTQHIETKEQKHNRTQENNMKGSRSKGSTLKSEKDFEYYLTKKYASKSDKERNLYFEKLLEAFRTLSEEAPEVFDSIAPEMLQRSIWSWRGADPLLSKKFNNWLIADYQWTPFDDILPKEEAFKQLPEVPQLNPAHLDEVHHSLIEALQERFYGDPHRWDASRRDQFIVLGMLATEGGYGVRQGKIIHHLGMGAEPGSVRGSNVVRAAKIALSRLANPLGIKLFSPAVGHGAERIHAFADEELSDIIARYILNHEAAILLPSTAVAEYSN
jgi:hypothetical protein